ncbi:MAG: aminotransferase class III-fold pyridoxal phosphate-dependent enzyme, partial [Rickettsiales bacterium]
LRGFKNHPWVADVRVKGAIGVIELNDAAPAAKSLRPHFVEHGVWLRPFANCIYLMPPFTISEVQLEKIFEAIKAVLK